MSEIPTADWTWIDAAAIRFEQEWKKGTRPRIEHFLAEVDESRWPPLLEELLRVERELLQRAGAESDVEEYRRRFPDSAALIDAIFGPQSERSEATEPTTPGPRRGDHRTSPCRASRASASKSLRPGTPAAPLR